MWGRETHMGKLRWYCRPWVLVLWLQVRVETPLSGLFGLKIVVLISRHLEMQLWNIVASECCFFSHTQCIRSNWDPSVTSVLLSHPRSPVLWGISLGRLLPSIFERWRVWRLRCLPWRTYRFAGKLMERWLLIHGDCDKKWFCSKHM